MTYNIVNVIKDTLTGNAEYVSPEIKQERLNICYKCEEYKKLTHQCGMCGCMMDMKSKYAQSSCPKGKWSQHINKV
jgi:hypothetical protein